MSIKTKLLKSAYLVSVVFPLIDVIRGIFFGIKKGWKDVNAGLVERENEKCRTIKKQILKGLR